MHRQHRTENRQAELSKLGIRRAKKCEFDRSSTSVSKSQKVIIVMLSHCANTRCHKPFLRLREGKLFLVETDRLTKPGEPLAPPFVRARQLQRQVEHYWLCDECAAQWTLIYDRDHGVALTPIKRPVASMAAAAQSGVA
jgi:hypothetical protein